MKSRRGAVKRFKVTGRGKVKRTRANRRHLLSSKTKKQKRKLRKSTVVSPGEAKNLRRLMPYL